MSNDNSSQNRNILLRNITSPDEEFQGDASHENQIKASKWNTWSKTLTFVTIILIGVSLIIFIFVSLILNGSKNSEIGNMNIKNSSLPQDSTLLSNSTFSNEQNTILNIGNSTFPSLQEYTANSSHIKTFESVLGVFKKAAVCSDRDICSEIGSLILKTEGSAVDSAIATLLCNGILTFQSLGIGGGMLMNIYIKDKSRAFSIDAREVAPFDAKSDMFAENNNLSLHSGLAIGVPGELMGYHIAHTNFGKLPWRKLVEPSIDLCHKGFPMSKHQYYAFKSNKIDDSKLKEVFIDKNTGKHFPPGTHIKPHSDLCKTYEIIAENGPLDFYNGNLSKLIIQDLKDLGSIITSYDLETYEADMVSSITMPLKKNILHVVPPISSGVVVANILSILDGFNMTKSDIADDISISRTIHRFTEAFKIAFAKRSELGDLRFNDVRELISQLTNPDVNADLRKQINDTNVLGDTQIYGGQFAGLNDKGTSHSVILAPNGDAVSVTSSINNYFGIGKIGTRTGILFNSVMNDFSLNFESNLSQLPPSPSNFVSSRKRPLSSMSPVLLTDSYGNLRLAVGAAGGSKIITAVAEVVARVLWFEENIKEAIDAPRYHHQLIPNVLQLEKDRFSKIIQQRLEQKGHKLVTYNDIGSVVCGIAANSTAIYANADFRKQGGVSGF